MKVSKTLAFLAVCLCLVPFLTAQVTRQTGVIKGVVSDPENMPLPGATVTATSPALMGTMVSGTDAKGAFRLANLPPGTYTITVSLTGFKTVIQPGIDVEVGQTFTLNMKTEPSAVLAEITVSAAAPVVDTQSSKIGEVITPDLLQRLPTNRSLTTILDTLPGANGTIETYSGSIHGGASTTTTFEVDGVNNNCPTTGGMLVDTQFDSMEEIEIITGGLPAQIGTTGGSFVNIVTKSGGNTFHGQAQAYYTNEHLTQSLYTNEELQAIGMSAPVLPVYDLNASFSLGGPILKDKLWFYGTLSRIGTEYHTDFIPATILGTYYGPYTDPASTYELFFKLTTQLSKNLRFFAMINGSLYNEAVAYGSAHRTYDSTFTFKNITTVAATGELTWLLSPNSYLLFRGGYTNLWFPIIARNRNNVGMYDVYTDYTWNGILDQESYITRRTIQGSVRLSHFLDEFLGGNHEIGAGVEYVHGFDRYGFARGNPLTLYFYDGDPYIIRREENIDHTDPDYGDGVVGLQSCGPNEGDTTKDLPEDRFSGFIQDSWTIKNRLSINLGLRYDHYNGGFGGGTSTGTNPDTLNYQIGEDFAQTLGFNPYGPMSLGPIKNTMNFGTLSPRLGLSYDLFGNGKTAIKVSWSRYNEPVPVMRIADAQPGIGYMYWVYWFDLNGNKVPDPPGIDKYVPTGGWGDYVRTEYDVIKARVDPNLASPYYNEITASISYELFKNFAVKLQYINKLGYKQWITALYDRSSGRFWYDPSTAPAGWYVPYTTTVPAIDNFPAREVTVYFMTNKAPTDNLFYRATNSPFTNRKYNALELTLDKRYAGGWALGGSVVYSQLRSYTPSDVNSFRFSDEFDGLDVPLAIKLYGSFELPLGFVGSFIYVHTEGGPYTRTVTVYAPEDFRAANDLFTDNATVELDPNGTYRSQSYDDLDFRLEKEFRFKFGTLGFFVDIFNLLGNKYLYIGTDPGGNWYPGQDYFEPSYWYKRIYGISGSRYLKFSARFTF